MKRNRRVVATWLSVVVVLAALAVSSQVDAVENTPPDKTSGQDSTVQFDDLLTQAQEKGKVEVIVRTDTADRSSNLVSLIPAGATVLREYSTLPMFAAEVDASALQQLAETPGVEAVYPNERALPTLDSSVPVINADDVHTAGITGTGVTVAILDTGIDVDHPFVAGRIVAPKCFSASSPSATTLCPNGQDTDTSADIEPGSNLVAGCVGMESTCDHGTHVAGIAAGSATGDPLNAPGDGVAPGASIMPIQVFSRFEGTDCTNLGVSSPCALSSSADQIAALDYVATQASAYNVAAANMSLGGGLYSTACDGNALYTPIANLLMANVTTVIAAGNSGALDEVGAPGCISIAATVGSTTDTDGVSSFSNRGPLLDLFAPGSSINSSIRNAYGFKNGTSMATPHVTGAFALARQAMPAMNATDTLNAFKSTGTPITYATDGSGGTATTPRLDVMSALFLNDDFEDAATVGSLPFSNPRDTAAATIQTGEPSPSCQPSFGRSVWYRMDVTAANDGPTLAHTIGSDFDTVVAVYQGTTLGSLTEVACNDDNNGLQSKVTFNAQAGNTYYFQVSGYSSSSGHVIFTLVAPPNDLFSDAQQVQPLPFLAQSSTAGASIEFGEPASSCGSNIGHTVWYRIDSTGSHKFTVDSIGSDFDTVLNVYQGTDIGSLTEVACNDDHTGFQSKVTFNAQAGNTYYIRVGGWSGASGNLTVHATVVAARADFGGDGSSDVAVFRPSGSGWFVQGGLSTQWGVTADVPIPADYNGDGTTDIAVFRPSDQTWYVQPSGSFPSGLTTQWGVPGDIPVPADFNGDGITDIAVFRPSDQTWYVQPSLSFPTGLATQWGVPGDIPVPADFDGDGADEVAVFRPSNQTWYSQAGLATQWGVYGDIPVPVDFNGDGYDEVAVYRPSDQTWYSQAGLATQWGIPGDKAVPGDYDGDGADEVAVFRPSDRTWYSQAGLATQWGLPGDTPVIVPPALRNL